jgi:small subunit ribosomal protein S27e
MTTLDYDFLHPTVSDESKLHKKKTLVPNPRSEFITIKCSTCNQLTTAFSHSNHIVRCGECETVLAYPTGGKIKLATNVSVRKKAA